ncbi:biotin/lipoyl-binding protein [Massilia sp. H-1]|nr:biotin/lipoyl-binding protein [Massilia sp. H-1]
MENARLRYLSMGSSIELAQETLRLSQVAFKNGQATSSDVADASLNYTKSRLERAQAAYEYDLALARLLGTTIPAGPTGGTGPHRHQRHRPQERLNTMAASSKKLGAAIVAVAVVALLAWGLFAAFQPVRQAVQGQIEAQETNVSSKIPGRVGKVHVALGTTVQQGQLLFELDSPRSARQDDAGKGGARRGLASGLPKGAGGRAAGRSDGGEVQLAAGANGRQASPR